MKKLITFLAVLSIAISTSFGQVLAPKGIVTGVSPNKRTLSVSELNTLDSIKTVKSIQKQIDDKPARDSAVLKQGTYLPVLPSNADPDSVKTVVEFNDKLYLAGASAVSGFPIYYVDQLNGHDDSTGLSPVKAWKTIAKVNSTTLVPNLVIKFCRGIGQIWREQLNLTSGSGTSSQRIIITAYGTGRKPTISGADIIGGGKWVNSYAAFPKVWGTVSPNADTRLAMVAIDDSLYTQVGTFAAVNSARKYFIKTASTPDSLFVWSATDPDSRTAEVSKRNYAAYGTQSYITLSYIKFTMAGNKGVLFNGQNTAIDGQVILDSCEIFRNRLAGIGFYDGWGTSIARNCLATYNGNNYISWGQQTVAGGGGAVAQSNAFSNCYSANSIHDYTVAGLYSDGTGFQLFSTNNGMVDHCISINDNTSCYLDANQNINQHYIVRYNNFSNTGTNVASYGIGINNDGAGCVSDIYYNVFNNCGYSDSAPIQLTWVYQGYVNFYNNDIYNSIAKTVKHQVFSLTGSHISFINNLFHFTSNTDDYFTIYHLNTSGFYSPSNRNTFYKLNVYGIAHVGGSQYSTIAAWRTFSGQDANSVITDPLFTTNGSNFELQSGSPAINAGQVISTIPQLDILGRPMNGLPDMGAYERQP